MLYYQGNPTSESTSRLHLILVFAKIKYPILFPPPPHSSPLFCPLDIIRNKIGVPRVFRVLFRVSNILSSFAKTKLGSLSPAFFSRISVRFFFWGAASQPRSFSLLRQRAFQPEPWLSSYWSHSLSSTAHPPSGHVLHVNCDSQESCLVLSCSQHFWSWAVKLHVTVEPAIHDSYIGYHEHQVPAYHFLWKSQHGQQQPYTFQSRGFTPEKTPLSSCSILRRLYSSYVSCPDPSVNTTYTLQYCSIIYSEDKVPSFLCPVGETYTPTSFRASQKKTQNWYLEVRLPLPLVMFKL